MNFVIPNTETLRVSDDLRFVIFKRVPPEGSSIAPTYELYIYERIRFGMTSAKEACEEAVRVANERGEVG